MKKRLLVFCAIALVVTTTVTAYNSRTGAARQNDGVEEANPQLTDSLMRRGKEILNELKLNDADVNALATYLKSQ